MNERFSKRIGINVIPTEIAIRYDAPEDFRKYLFFVMQKYGYGLKKLREVVCLAAKLAPNSNNWGENDYMKSEIEEKIVSCFWPYIYDLIESFYKILNDSGKKDSSEEINDYFLIQRANTKRSIGEVQKMTEIIQSIIIRSK